MGSGRETYHQKLFRINAEISCFSYVKHVWIVGLFKRELVGC